MKCLCPTLFCCCCWYCCHCRLDTLVCVLVCVCTHVWLCVLVSVSEKQRKLICSIRWNKNEKNGCCCSLSPQNPGPIMKALRMHPLPPILGDMGSHMTGCVLALKRNTFTFISDQNQIHVSNTWLVFEVFDLPQCFHVWSCSISCMVLSKLNQVHTKCLTAFEKMFYPLVFKCMRYP